MRSALPLAALALLTGCPKRMPPPETLVDRKWQGTVQVTSPCAHGSYTGSDLNICLVAVTQTEGWLQFDVDWDSETLREDCQFFSFFGGFYDGGLRLVRDEEPDDQLHLRFQGDTLVGFFQVHPSCEAWPVELIRTR